MGDVTSSVSGHGQPLPVQDPSKDSSAAAIVDHEPAPCDDSSDGWIPVKPRRKSKKHTSNFPKGKEVLAVAAASVMSNRSDAPSSCAGVVNSLGTGAVIDAGVDLGATSCMATLILGAASLATTPLMFPPWVNRSTTIGSSSFSRIILVVEGSPLLMLPHESLLSAYQGLQSPAPPSCGDIVSCCSVLLFGYHSGFCAGF